MKISFQEDELTLSEFAFLAWIIFLIQVTNGFYLVDAVAMMLYCLISGNKFKFLRGKFGELICVKD